MAYAKDPSMQFRYNGKVCHWNKDATKLTVDELALLEYRLENTTVFKKMFLKKVQGLSCQICSTMAMAGKASMDAHINGKKHQRAIELVAEYRHKTLKSLAEENAAKTSAPTVKAPPAPIGKAPPAPIISKSTPTKATPAANAKPAAAAAKPGATPATPKAAAKPAAAATPGTPKPAAKPAAAPGTPKAAATPKTGGAAAAATKTAATPAKTAAGAVKAGTPAAKVATPATKAATPAAKAATPAAKAATPAAKPGAPKAPAAKPAGTPAKQTAPAAKPATTPQATNAKEAKVEVKDEEPTPMETDESNAVSKSDTVIVQEPTIEVVDLLSDSEEPPTKPISDNNASAAAAAAAPAEKPQQANNDNSDPTTLRQLQTLKSAIATLGLGELKKVEFRIDNAKWEPLVSIVGEKYCCHICKKTDMNTFYDLKTHMNQINHKNKLADIQQLHHPVMCPMNVETARSIYDPNELKAKERELVNQKYQVTGQLPLEEFKLKHIFLPINELLKVEYRTDKSIIWYNLINKNGQVYKCVLCKTPFMGNVKNILEHVHGRKHLVAAHEIAYLHHPVYCVGYGQTENFAQDIQMDGVGKENLVINPAAVMKGTGDTPRQKTPPAPTGRKIPTVARNDPQQTKRPAAAAPAGGPQNKRPALTTHPGLQQQNQQQKGPSFSNKVITNKPETDAHIEGYIGVEYVVKILRNATDPSPRFECCLCELESDGYGMQAHLKSSQHRLKYLDRHFRTVMREFENFRNDPTCKNVLGEIARLLAVAIEKHHGRDLPFECLQEEYRINRPEIMAKVFSFRHASELSGPSMVHVIDKTTLHEMLQNKAAFGNPDAEPKRRTTFDVRDEMAPKRVRMDDENYLDVDEHRRLVDQFLRNTNRDNVDRRHRSRSRGRSRGRSRDRWAEQGRGRRSRSRSMGRRRSHSGDKWTAYKRMFDHSIRDLDTDYKRFERDPETHPLYQKEWKIFWQKRSEELANDGRDPTNYDFQPEWILFWTRRMDQIYEEEVDHLKKRLRDRLNLPYHNNDLRERRYHLGIHRQPTSAFSQIRQSMDNIGPGGPNMGPGGPNMGPGGPNMAPGPNMMGLDAPPIEAPGGPFMGGADGPRMGGPRGPFMGGPDGPRMGGPVGPVMGGPAGPHMGGPGGPVRSGPGGPHMGGPGGPNMGGPVGQNMGGPHMGGPFVGGMGGPVGPHMGGPGGPHMGGPGGFNMGGPQMMGAGGDNVPFNRNQPNAGQWSGPNFGPHQNNIPEKVAPNQSAAGAKQPIHRTIRPLLPANSQQETGPKPQPQQNKPSSQSQQPQRPQQNQRDELDNKRNEQKRESIVTAAKNAKHPGDGKRNASMHIEDDLLDSSPLTVLSVLRLLAALEDHLGILGPRVVDLMAKALTLEKAKPGSADKNLLTAENTVFLETVREKLRGQIVVGVLDASKTRAVNNAIKVLTELLNKHMSDAPPAPVVERVQLTKPAQLVPMAPSRVTQQKQPDTNDGDEKRDLAAKLAAALAAQGKTNVTSDQLEQLIAVYSLIEKKQKETANEPKKQNLSDLLVDSLKETSSRPEENNARVDNNRNTSSFENRGPQRPTPLMDIQPYTNANSSSSSRQFPSSGRNQSSNSGFGQSSSQSSSNLPSFMSSSFSLSNFDTSLSLSSLPPLSFSRNQDSNRLQQGSSDNTPSYMTSIGRGGSASSKQQDMVAYPSIWQRGSATTTSSTTNRNQSSNQQAPLGWQQNNSNNRNSANWSQNRNRR